MSLTKIGSIGINTGIAFAGVTTITTLNGSDAVLSVGGTVNFVSDVSIGGTVSIAGTLTYEDVTNVDAVGLITARDGIKVGSGITLSPDGDIFTTGITTISENLKVGTGVTISPDGDIFFTGIMTGSASGLSGDASGLTALNATQLTSGTIPDARFPATLPAVSGANLTGLAAGGAFIKGVVGVTTLTPVGIETSTVTRKDLIGPGGNTVTGAGSSFHGAYMGDGFLSFNTEFSNSSGYYISTFTNALVAGPMQLGATLTIDGTFTII